MPVSVEKRKGLLVERGIKVVELARALGVSQGHISQVMRGGRRSQRVEEAIVEAINATQPIGERRPARRWSCAELFGPIADPANRQGAA